MSFHVGQKVVCVFDDWDLTHPSRRGVLVPKVGREYIIRSLNWDAKGNVGLRFCWLMNSARQCSDGFDEPAFGGFRSDGSPNFRPVIERNTSIEIFERILNNPQRAIEEV
jgi:hypothetical protein